MEKKREMTEYFDFGLPDLVSFDEGPEGVNGLMEVLTLCSVNILYSSSEVPLM